MPRCDNCGRNNPPVATFCQDCGTRLEPEAFGSGPSAAPDSGPAGAGDVAEVQCPACQTTNPTTMTFCRQCGGRLPDAEEVTPPPSIACPNCGRSTPEGFNFCQHCGFKLADGEVSGPANPPTPPVGLPVSTAAEPPPSTPPQHAGARGRSITPGRGVEPLQPPAAVVAPVSHGAPLTTGTPVVPASPVLTSSGYRGDNARATPMAAPNAVTGTIAPDGSRRDYNDTVSENPPFRLVSVNRDGSDGVSFPVVGERLDIGRRTGTLLFEDDGYLSDRHVRLERRGDDYYLVDLDSLNGVYVRIRDKEELRDGNRFLVGMEVLRFELISERERDPAPAVEHGVLVFGTPPKLPWARLRQITTAGICRDVFHLYRAEVVVGRESGDIVFSDDDFMSRMHTAIRNEGGKAWLVDLNSSNGTYLQVDGERRLVPGDFIRLGDQLLRYESA